MRTIEETALTVYRETLYHEEKSKNTIDKYNRYCKKNISQKEKRCRSAK